MGEVGDESVDWAAERGFGSVVDGVICAVRELPFSSVVWASCPVLWIMDPSLRERIKADCTPGREVRCESSAVTCWGTCCVRFGAY